MNFINTSNAVIDSSLRTPYLSFPVLSRIPFIKHGFSTRLGGVSEGIFATLNLGTDSGEQIDDPARVEENYTRIAGSIGVDVHSLVISKQVHKTNIRVVTSEDRGKGLFIPRDYDEIDGLITNEPKITLVTKYADCVPLYFVDQNKKAIGLSHSGWRGTVAEIGRITVEELTKNYHSDPAELIAVIGPSICKSCFEISEDVAVEFEKAFPNAFATGILTPLEKKGKYLCDLWEANRQVLLKAGLKSNNIHTSGVCTCCNDDILFSHRKTQGRRGSLAAFLAMIQ